MRPRDIVICESTYADVEHDDRQMVEERFAESLKETLWEGGSAVVPAFAIGRTQKFSSSVKSTTFLVMSTGWGKQVTQMLLEYPAFLRDPDAFQRAKSHARYVTGRNGQRARIIDQQAVVVTTSGMLSGGPAMTYIPRD